MSNALAIAMVTGALKVYLHKSLNAASNQTLMGNLNAKANTISPNELDSKMKGAGVNIFLYRVTPNAAHRNADLPTRTLNGETRQRPRIALDLHYMLTFTGNEATLEPQRVMGIVMRALHTRPVLTRKTIAETPTLDATLSFLSASDLDQEIETIKFTPLTLSLDELSKLWSTFFQTPYRLSMVYKASVVQIEKAEPTPYVLPVKTRHISVTPSLDAPAVSPDQLSGLQLWLKSDAGLTYDLDGVSFWADQSGNEHHASQNNVNRRPLLVSHALETFPALRFDGANDYLAIQGLNYNGPGAIAGITVCALVRSGSTKRQIIASFDRAQYWQLALKDHNTVKVGWGTREQGGTSKYLPSPSAYTDNLWHLVCGWFKQGENPDKRLFVDGIEVASKQSHNGNAVGGGAERYGHIGAGSKSAVQDDGQLGPKWFLKGDLVELIVYDRALTNTERSGLEQYVLKRYTTPKTAPTI